LFHKLKQTENHRINRERQEETIDSSELVKECAILVKSNREYVKIMHHTLGKVRFITFC